MMNPKVKAMIRNLSPNERRALVGIWVEDPKLVTKTAFRSLKNRGVIQEYRIQEGWGDAAHELTEFAHRLGYRSPSARFVDIARFRPNMSGRVWYVTWTYIANYSEKPYRVRADSADEAAKEVMDFYSSKFRKKASVMVHSRAPVIYVRGRDVSKLTAKDMESVLD